jgi:hypothetical protein
LRAFSKLGIPIHLDPIQKSIQIGVLGEANHAMSSLTHLCFAFAVQTDGWLEFMGMEKFNRDECHHRPGHNSILIVDAEETGLGVMHMLVDGFDDY